jgi:small subunit ribosomal protein S3
MGQKVNPISFRLKVNKGWSSKWMSDKLTPKYLNEDITVRNYIMKSLAANSVANVVIERNNADAFVKIHSARPGRVIGKGGASLDALREILKKKMPSTSSIKVDVVEIKTPDLNARLAALAVAQQLEKRIAFRRAMKKVMQQTMKAGAKGIRVRVSGRLNGAEMARTEWYMEGKVPLHTLRENIDYATAEAMTMTGLIGIKVWISLGEVLDKPAEIMAKRN